MTLLVKSYLSFLIQHLAKKEQPKYLTIKLDENKQKVYRPLKESIFKDLSYITEIRLIVYLLIIVSLPFDRPDLVLKNKIPNDQVTYIFDNEPRNREIIKRMYSGIRKRLQPCRGDPDDRTT